MSMLRDKGYFVRYWGKDEVSPDRLIIDYVFRGDKMYEAVCYFTFDDIALCQNPKLNIFFKVIGKPRGWYSAMRKKATTYFKEAVDAADGFNKTLYDLHGQ